MRRGEGNLGTEALECISRASRLEFQGTGMRFLGAGLMLRCPSIPVLQAHIQRVTEIKANPVPFRTPKTKQFHCLLEKGPSQL